jgi:hypothetical protein
MTTNGSESYLAKSEKQLPQFEDKDDNCSNKLQHS